MTRPQHHQISLMLILTLISKSLILIVDFYFNLLGFCRFELEMLLVLLLVGAGKLNLLISHEVSLISLILLITTEKLLLALIAFTLKLFHLFFSCHVITLVVNQTNVRHLR